MSEIEELRNEITELREELKDTQKALQWQEYQRRVIERYFERLTSRRDWTDRQRKLADFIPFWSFFHPLSVLVSEPFSIWALDELDNVIEDEKTVEKEAKERSAAFRRDFTFTVDDGEGGRKRIYPLREE